MAHDVGLLVGRAEVTPVPPARKVAAARRRRQASHSQPLTLELDGAHPTPLYHQIAQAIRWKIGTGALAAGAALPSLRDAERLWGVNYHTVRQAYAELQRQGYLESRRRSGTKVVSVGGTPREIADKSSLTRFLDTVHNEARSRFGLDVKQLTSLLLQRTAALKPRGRVVVVECNAHQCREIAAQLEARCAIEAVSWHLGRRGAPPDLPIIGTHFHQHEMRQRWPNRVPQMHFVALQLDPELREQLAKRAEALGIARVVVCEQEQATGRELAADLKRRIARHFTITVTTRRPQDVLMDKSAAIVAVAPRVWDTLSATLRAHPRIMELRHIVSPADLDALTRSR